MKFIDMLHFLLTGSKAIVGQNILEEKSAHICDAANQPCVITGVTEKFSVSPYALEFTIATFERRIK